MRISSSIAVASIIAASLAIAGAQGSLSRPTNLRIVSGNAGVRATASGRAHEYFDSLVALPQHLRSWSLRNQDQLDQLAGRGPSTYFTYTFPNDTYPDAQDAAKFYKPVDSAVGGKSDSIPGNQQLRMPIDIAHSSGDTILVVWDWYYGQEFALCHGRVQNYKIFNIRSSPGGDANGNIYLGTKIAFVDGDRTAEPGDVGTHYNAFVPSKGGFPAGMVKADTTTPTGLGSLPNRRYQLHSGKWTRYIMEIRTNVPGSDRAFDEWKSLNSGLDYREFNATNWNMISQWLLDEDRDTVRVLHRVPWKMVETHLAYFNYEFNTSSLPPGQTCALVGYGRDVVVLRNYATNVSETDPRIFAKPVR